MKLTYTSARSHFLNWVTAMSLRKHCVAVEKVMRAAAHHYAAGDADEEQFAIAGLLHDGDYERWPAEHPARMVAWLKDQEADAIAQAVACHYSRWGCEPVNMLDKCLLACDEPTGFVMACSLVRPDGITTLKVKSVLRKLRDRSFAVKVDRQEVALGADLLGVRLEDHLQFIIDALQPFADELGIGPRVSSNLDHRLPTRHENRTPRQCCGCKSATCPDRRSAS